jgi:hypothetical protein
MHEQKQPPYRGCFFCVEPNVKSSNALYAISNNRDSHRSACRRAALTIDTNLVEEILMSTLARWTAPVIIFLLAACGGGGGVAPPVNLQAPVAPAVNVAAAWSNYVGAPHSWTMRGKGSDARTHEMTVEMKPGASAAFPMTKSTGQTIAQSIRFAIDGVNTVSTDGTLFFTPQTMIGVATRDGACLAARSAMAALPSASTAGASGPMFVLEGYAGCTISGQKLGTTTYKWSVEAEGSLTFFCITSQQQNADAANIGTEADCIEADASGTLGAKAKFTITRPDGNIISGKNY